MPNEFVGQGFPFPLRIDHTGSMTLISGEDEIKNAITIILSTAFGERPFRPRFGCQIWELIFDPINDATFGLMEMYVEDALRMWEPRIVVDSVAADAGNGDGEILLEIEFTIVSTNDKRNLVFPFYLIPAEEE